MTGCDPSAVVSRHDPFRNVRVADVQECGRFGGGLVPELADGAVLVDAVFFVPGGLGDRGTGEQHRQGDDPVVPAGASSCEPCMHGSSLERQPRNLAEIARGGKGVGRTRGSSPSSTIDGMFPGGTRWHDRAAAAISLGVPMM